MTPKRRAVGKRRTAAAPPRVKRQTPAAPAVAMGVVAANAGANEVRINVPGREPVTLHLPDTPQMQREALRWSYSLRNRQRWNSRSDVLDRQRDDITELARQWLTPQVLPDIAANDLVEVEIPFTREEDAWELRVMPWEFLIATATRGLRGSRPLTVVRYLRRTTAPKTPLVSPTRWLYIESAAGALRDDYDFSSERALVDSSAKEALNANDKMDLVCDPNPAQLMTALGAVRDGHVVHFAGFDPNQGLRLLKDSGADPLDGFLVNGSSEQADKKGYRPVQVIAAADLASALTSNGRSPRLVALNLHYSASRTAALCAADGAEAAIGFQDTFDDALAELFYATFYRAWRLSEWNTVAAFRHAWTYVLKQGRDLQGSGLVLWSRRSIRETLAGYWETGKKDSKKYDVGDIRRAWQVAVTAKHQALTPDTARQHLGVDVKPKDALNYSLLHNNGMLFDKFTIQKNTVDVGAVNDIHVTVELSVGTDSFPYRATVALDEELMQFDLAPRIKMSLASSLSRGLREAVRTSVFVEVRWQDTIIRRETFPITLLPIDEWVDTDENRIWLPSFVLPRDPAVAKIIERAQRYLMAIADDPSMGFSGYQAAIDDDPTNPFPPASRCEGVDAQVRAIWSALLYELPLSYINPPPVFSDYSQRLRLPSDVVDGGRGTCIDLALLLASCLEYVDIYPVVFLLTDHAFPGYWRDSNYFDRFLPANPEEANITARDRTGARTAQRYSWYLEKEHFRELLIEIHEGRLVPLETVSLTAHEGFAAAMEKGCSNLTSQSGFQAMLNIFSARTDDKNRVTPLPLIRS